MSFLTPFYLLGALAIAAPIVFHLIRRTTRGEVPFSSLIFLSPSPPRLTRRSRLDQWLLLLLRAAAVILLAAAFARPFLREAAGLSLGDAGQGRVALLMDTSASMRRGDLWSQAQARAGEVIDQCLPGDQLAVFAFDVKSRSLMGFEEAATMDPARRSAVALALVERLTPGWGASHLGQALVDVAGAIAHVGDTAGNASRQRRRIVLISDLPQGSRLEPLGNFEWPSDVELDLKTVSREGSNAGLQWLTEQEADEPDARAVTDLRVRVSNDATSQRETFQLAWGTAAPISVYVPPGESRVVRVPRPTGLAAAQTLILQGDTEEFDNRLFIARDAAASSTVLFVGRDSSDDPSGLAYFLDRAFGATPQRTVRVESRSPSERIAMAPGSRVTLIVHAGEVVGENVPILKQYANDGGTVLLVVTSAGKLPVLSAMLDLPTLDVEDSPSGADAILTEIAFDHPLFAPFATPQYNDFTKIRFWKHRRLPTTGLGDLRVLARFEKGDPAVLEKPMGRGRLVVLTSGWNPADSQLARSSKFVPLMSTLLDGPRGDQDVVASRLVGEFMAVPVGSVALRRPDGSMITLPAGTTQYDTTDLPGVYTVETAQGAREVAVNVDPLESKTAPLAPEALQQYGCRLAMTEARAEAERAAQRQLQSVELEGRQKLWRPLILLVLVVVMVETWLAGRRARPRPGQGEALA